MLAPAFLGALRSFAGLGFRRSSHLEKWLSATGGLVGILGVVLITEAKLGLGGSAGLVASMGASAVLLFAVPHGALSQPWPVFGGHLVSAVIGVTCAMLLDQPYLAAAVAVALAIGAMYYLRCIHPPGGATALSAVAGGDAVHALGYHYVVTPVLVNVVIILVVAVLFNFPFPWRRYPATWARTDKQPATADPGPSEAERFSREELAAAARAIDPAQVTGANDLDTLCTLARCNNDSTGMRGEDIHIGAWYCNGAFGPQWQVREVIAEDNGILTYRIVAGAERRYKGTASRDRFARWARYPVRRNENSWQRLDATAIDDASRNRNYRSDV